MPSRSRVLVRLAPFRWVLEPALALSLCAAWLLTGTPGGLPPAFALVFSCAAVALSRVLPGVALGLLWVAALVELTGPALLPAAPAVIGALTVLAAVFGIAAHAGPVLRWLDLGSAVLLGALAGFLLTVRGHLSFPQFGPLIGGYDTGPAAGLLLMSLLLIVAFVAGWLLGYLVARQRAVVTPGRNSVLLWLASSGGSAAVEGAAESPGLVRKLTRRQLTFDVVVATVFAVLCILAVAANGFGGEAGSRSGFVVTIGLIVAVGVRRISPGVALAVAWLSAVLQMSTGHAILFSDIGILVVLYATAAYGDRIVRWAGLASAGAGAIVAALYLSLTAAVDQAYLDVVSFAITRLALQFVFLALVSATVLGLSWVLGLLVRTWRNARSSRRAQATAELDRARAVEDVVVEQERTRIARDMHDVVAHSLAVVIAQADGARYARSDDPDAVDAALTTIASTARSALADVRVLLAQLRHAEPEGPQPTLADLDRTVAQLRASGLDVRVERGCPLENVGAAQQIAAYRIVQEALTNALRHGDTGRPVSVELAQSTIEDGRAAIAITVRNSMHDIPSAPGSTGAHPRIGHGLPGMRERASLTGGTLTTEAVDGVFVVRAVLPLGVVA